MSGSLKHADFSGLMSISFYSISAIEVFRDASANENILSAVESALLAVVSNVTTFVSSVSVSSMLQEEDHIEFSFMVRANTAAFWSDTLTTDEEKNKLIAMELQYKLASNLTVHQIVKELHSYNDFKAVSDVVFGMVQYDRDFEEPNQDSYTYDAQSDDEIDTTEKRPNTLSPVYLIMVLAVISSVAIALS
jgi:hypothetical protein